MIEIEYSPSFIRIYKKLHPGLRSEIKEKITLFQDRNNHKSLRVHKLGGRTRGAYAFSINYKLRISFDFKGPNLAKFLLVGNHDEIY